MHTTNVGIQKVNRAGLICFNLAGQVLLVRALNTKEEWVFPKGHIEPGEETFQTAERECREECGIVASTVGGPIGITSYILYKGSPYEDHVVIEWFAGLANGLVDMPVLPDYAEFERRERRWFHWNRALEELAFKDLKDMLKIALCFRD